MKKKLVIFDMDGTILDTLEDLTDSLNHALLVNGYPIHTIDKVRNFVGNGRRKLVERAVPEGTDEKGITAVYEELGTYYPDHCANKTKPYEGIIELFEALKERGIYIAINSNKDDAEVRTLAKQYYGDLVDFSVGALVNIPKKPAPDGVNKIMEHLGLLREETIYIGDSEVDIETAVNGNLDAIIVDWGFRERKVLEKYIEKIYKEMNYKKKMQVVSDWEKVLECI